jgi:hypothetical protein
MDALGLVDESRGPRCRPVHIVSLYLSLLLCMYVCVCLCICALGRYAIPLE